VRGGGNGVGVDTGLEGSSEDGGGVVLGALDEVGARIGDEVVAPRAGLVALLPIGAVVPLPIGAVALVPIGASVTATGIGLSVGEASGLAVGLGVTFFLLFEVEQANCSSNRLTTIELKTN
jgi:hypothetical protein